MMGMAKDIFVEFVILEIRSRRPPLDPESGLEASVIALPCARHTMAEAAQQAELYGEEEGRRLKIYMRFIFQVLSARSNL